MSYRDRRLYFVAMQQKLNDRQLLLELVPTNVDNCVCTTCKHTVLKCNCSGRGGFPTHCNIAFYLMEIYNARMIRKLWDGCSNEIKTQIWAMRNTSSYITHTQEILDCGRKTFIVTVDESVYIERKPHLWTSITYKESNMLENVSYYPYYISLLPIMLKDFIASTKFEDIRVNS